MTAQSTRITANLAGIRERIARAARQSGRAEADVQLIAVTKSFPLELARSLVQTGCADLGESRPQQLWERAEQLHDLTIRWHLIGHLQRNKVQRVLPYVHLLHSLDSVRLWRAVSQWANQQQRSMAALIEVNISGDVSKHGFAPADVAGAIAMMHDAPGVEVRGLMAMASREGGPDQARRDFAALRQLRDALRQRFPVGISFAELSMGMSDDFEVAIEEGATIVRIGSALLEGVAV